MTKVKIQFRGPHPDSSTHFAALVTSQNSFPWYARDDFNPEVYLPKVPVMQSDVSSHSSRQPQ